MLLQEKILTNLQMQNIIVLNLKKRKGEDMKTLANKVDEELHKQFKIYAINQGRTVTEVVVELIKRELGIKKEQSQ